MLNTLVKQCGKPKINSMTKYPSILTLHEMGDRGVLKDNLTTQIGNDEELFATEKIDGTNVRIICMGNEYLVGARESILHYSGDLYYDSSMDIVDGLRDIGVCIPRTPEDALTVIYGELFGGKISSNSKWYGKEAKGFRVFDIAIFKDMSVLNMPLPEISLWRERMTASGMAYGQPFLPIEEMYSRFPMFAYAPMVKFGLGDCAHETILHNLMQAVPNSLVALTKTATKQAEGVVVRNRDRSKIVKLRFEDYERTLRKR